jgi:hypothetical protein
MDARPGDGGKEISLLKVEDWAVLWSKKTPTQAGVFAPIHLWNGRLQIKFYDIEFAIDLKIRSVVEIVYGFFAL